MAEEGRDVILPTGIGTDATTAPFFASLVSSGRLCSFLDFVTNAEIWSGIGHNRARFALLTFGGRHHRVERARFAVMNKHPRDLNRPGVMFALSPEEFLALNPNTGTAPVFNSIIDADITLGVYKRHPVLVRDDADGGNPWGLGFLRMFDMANDSGLFSGTDDLREAGAAFDGWAWVQGDRRWLPLYEAKLLSHYDQRFSTYRDLPFGYEGTALPRLSHEQHDDPAVEPLARYWVTENEVDRALAGRWDRGWLSGWRDIARASDARTMVPSVLPRSAVGDGFLLAFPAEPADGALLQAVWSSFAFDYVARQKLSGTHMKYFVIKQIACPTPATFDNVPAWADAPLREVVLPRVLELTYTSHRIAPYARDLGDPGQPFRWIPERRARLRAELDAALLHVYGLIREEAEHVLDSFTVVRRYEERDFGEFRTKRLVLESYDAIAGAAASEVPWRSPLLPAPGHGPRHDSRSSE